MRHRSSFIVDRLAIIERLAVHAAREIQPLAALTPVGARQERERLSRELARGRHPSPRWVYSPRRHDDLRLALDAAERVLLRPAADEPGGIAGLYLGRIRELATEADLCAAAGTARVGALARERFTPSDPHVADAASDLCRTWLADAADAREDAPPGPVASDAPDPRSLLSRMRQAVGALRLPFSVVACPALASLAATGEGVVLVATGRLLSDEDTERTILHEIEGHVVPRARALSMPSALFRAGTARGADDQEGRALVIEERAGHLGRARRHRLAARHRAVESMLAGASFAEIARTLVDVHGLRPNDAVVVTERAFRGSDGSYPGLGRERVYLESFLRVRGHLAAHPADDLVLACGQVAIEAVEMMRSLAANARSSLADLGDAASHEGEEAAAS